MPLTHDPSTPAGAAASEHLATDIVGWLTTVDPDGAPHTSAIWVLWRDGEVLIYSGKRAPRNGNIEANANVSFHLDSRSEGDAYATTTGTARIDPGARPADQDPEYMAKYARKIAEYGWTEAWFAAEYPFAVRVTPSRWRLGSG
jgi:PPOX class probable F420-dependent enzyme